MSGHEPDDDGEIAPPTPPTGNPQEVLDLLAEGVPMALIADLIDPAGPPSPVILEEEGGPSEAWWSPEYRPDDGENRGADAPGEGADDVEARADDADPDRRDA